MGGSNTGMTGGNDLAGQFMSNQATQPTAAPQIMSPQATPMSQMPQMQIQQPQRQPLPQMPAMPPAPPPVQPQQPPSPAGYENVGGQRDKRFSVVPRWNDQTGQLDMPNMGLYAEDKPGTFRDGILRSVHGSGQYLIPGQPGYPGAGGLAAPNPPPLQMPSRFQEMARALNERGRQSRGS